jgi:hypothetical protein
LSVRGRCDCEDDEPEPPRIAAACILLSIVAVIPRWCAYLLRFDMCWQGIRIVAFVVCHIVLYWRRRRGILSRRQSRVVLGSIMTRIRAFDV